MMINILLKIFLKILKKKKKKLNLINNELYDVCINDKLFKNIENEIIKFIEKKTQNDFDKFIYRKKKLKKKFVFLGDIDSINIEIIHKSHKLLKNKVKYILLGNIKDLSKYLKKLQSKLNINEIMIL